MAKQQKKAPETVRLVSAAGTKVTVSKDQAEKYIARGFKSATGGRKSASAQSE